MPHVSRFKKRSSDRSGFDYFQIGLVKDKNWLVAPDERDDPPPSKRSLGGEGDVSGSPRSSSSFVTQTGTGLLDVPTEVDNPIVYVLAADGIRPSTHPFMRISGSNGTVNITADPQIAAGKESQILTLVCVDSGVQFDHGTGVNMIGSAGYLMRSGDVSVFMYHTGGTVWDEVSRSPGWRR